MSSRKARTLSHCGVWADYDNDGHLDLGVGIGSILGARNNYLDRNNGDASFSRITSGTLVATPANSEAVAGGDYDNAGFLDLFVSRGGFFVSQLCTLFRNNGNSILQLRIGRIPIRQIASCNSKFLLDSPLHVRMGTRMAPLAAPQNIINQESINRMSTSTQSPSRSGNRRNFLKTTGLLALSAPAAMAASPRPAPGQSRWWRGRNRLVLTADGFVDPTFVLPPPGPIVIPLINRPAVRMRVIFPVSEIKCLLGVQITIEDLDWNLPVPLPDALPPGVPNPIPVSFIELEVSDVTFGSGPLYGSAERKPAVALSGNVVANPVPSPFGDLTGEPMTVSAGYEIMDMSTGAAEFTFLGGFAAGSHISICPTAVGTLRVRP